MAYADRNQSGNRAVSIVIVAILLAALGYAFVTGLAYQYVKKVQQKMNTFDVAPPPPPPPPDVPPPPPPPDQPMTAPPVVAPPAIVPVPAPPVQIQTVTTPPPAINLTPVAAPPAPKPAPPAPPHVSQAAGPKGNPSDWITTDDYPSSALRAGDEGTSSISWTINTQGRVENCHVTHSSGHSSLDEAACRAITRRGRYVPAKDQNGNPIESTQSRNVVWRIPD